jgi:hypothetical protein
MALTNHGVAPFYYEWPAEIAIAGATGPLLQTWPSGHSLTGILPGAGETLWDLTLPTKTLPAGNFTLLLRVPNVLPNGRPVRFANRTQDDRFPGWLTLGEFKRKP